MSADHSEIKRYQERMMKASKRLQDMVVPVGNAKQVIEFDSDKRKNILAKYTAKYLKEDQSATAAEVLARADELYKAELEQYAKVLEDAYITHFKYNCEQTSFACAQSLLAVEREILHKFPE